MVTITLAPESLATIDRERGVWSRGEFIELLLNPYHSRQAKPAMRKSSHKPAVSPAYVSNLPEGQQRKASKT